MASRLGASDASEVVESWEARRRPSHASGGSMLGRLGGPGAAAGAADDGGAALDDPLLPRGGAIQAGLFCTLEWCKSKASALRNSEGVPL